MHDFTVGNLSPKQQRLSRFGSAAQVSLPITNRGEQRTKFALEAADPAGVCHFEFRLPGQADLARQAEVWLSPGETTEVAVRVTPPPLPVITLAPPTHHFTVTVTNLTGRHAARSLLGQIKTTPVIGPGPVTFIITCIICLLATAMYLAQTAILPLPDPTLVKRDKATPQAGAIDEATVLREIEALSPAEDDDSPVAAEMSLEEIFQEIGPQYDLDWRLLAEVAYQESRMDPLAVGRDSDLGLMQIIPSTWTAWAPKVGVTDPFDPYSNVLVGAAYLAHNRDYARSRGYTEAYWMLIGYNWGPNNLRRVFDEGGDVGQVPARRYRYALDILQAKAMGLERWRNVPLADAD